MDRKQVIGIAFGVVLLCFLVVPPFVPRGPAIPIKLEYLSTRFAADLGSYEAEFEVKNSSGRRVSYSVNPTEFLDWNGVWKNVGIRDRVRSHNLDAYQSQHIQVEIPPSISAHMWRASVVLVVEPTRLEAMFQRALVTLRLRKTMARVRSDVVMSPPFPSVTNISSGPLKQAHREN